ncbi:MAG: hypothetical protein LBQ60_21845 [Bacteroidales bacterium]|nr:hypothetical protein [Bacteroidales bacterium]
MIHIIYLAYGNNADIYCQTFFSMQTFWLYHPDISIHLVTDHPEYFKKFPENKPLTIHTVEQETIKEWMWTGSKNFGFRAKQKSIQLMINLYPDTPLMFIDSDTFIYGSMDRLFHLLENGTAILHEYENLLSRPTTKTERHVWKRVGNRTVEGVSITSGHAMWNSGVVGIPVKRNKELIDTAIQLSDKLSYLVDRNTFMEQMSFSILMSDYYTLTDAKDVVAHYWGNKDGWNKAIQDIYLRSYLLQLSFEEEMSMIRDYDLSSVPYRKRKNNTAARICKRAERIFPDKDYRYITPDKSH